MCAGTDTAAGGFTATFTATATRGSTCTAIDPREERLPASREAKCAEPRADRGIIEVRLGLLPDLGGCSRLPAIVGLGNAKELIMTGKPIDGHEAHRIGFANRIAPAEELEACTQGLADELLAGAPRAVGLAKRVMDVAAKPALSETLARELEAQEVLAASEDFVEGAAAFLEQRPPEFAGR